MNSITDADLDKFYNSNDKDIDNSNDMKRTENAINGKYIECLERIFGMTADDNKLASKDELDLSAPWIIWAKKVYAFFENDDTIQVDYNADEDPNKIDINTDSFEKYYALTKLLPPYKDFGSFRLVIDIHYTSYESRSYKDLYQCLLKDNKIVDRVLPQSYTYIIFTKDIAKYWTDNLGDPNGYTFELYQDIAKDIFKDIPGVFFTTYSNE